MDFDNELDKFKTEAQEEYIELGEEVYNLLDIETKNLVNRLPPISIYNRFDRFDMVEEADNILRVSFAITELLLSIETILSDRTYHNNYASFSNNGEKLNFILEEGKKHKTVSKNYFISGMAENSDMPENIIEKIWEIFRDYVVKEFNGVDDFFGLEFLDGEIFLKKEVK